MMKRENYNYQRSALLVGFMASLAKQRCCFVVVVVVERKVANDNTSFPERTQSRPAIDAVLITIKTFDILSRRFV